MREAIAPNTIPPFLYVRKWLKLSAWSVVAVLLIWEMGLPKPLSTDLFLWAIAFTLLASALYYLVGKDALHPASMFSTIWCILIWVYAFSPIVLDIATASTVLLVFLGVASFGIGSHAGSRPFLSSAVSPQQPCRRPFVQQFLIGYSAVAGLWFAADIWRLGSAGEGFAGHIIAARDVIITSFMMGKSPYSSPFVSTAPTVITLTALLMQADCVSIRKRRFMFALAFVVAVLTTGRTFLVELFVGSLIIYSVKNRPDRRFLKLLKLFLPTAVAALAVLSAVALITKKEMQGGDGLLELIGKSLVIYLVGGIPAFDFARNHPTLFTPSANLVLADFRWLTAPFAKPADIPMFLPWVNIPIPINVYTVFYDFFLGFGYLGTVIAMFVCGAVCGNIYFRATRGSQPALVFYCILGYAIAMSGFVNAFKMFATFAQVALFLIGYFKFSRWDYGNKRLAQSVGSSGIGSIRPYQVTRPRSLALSETRKN